MRKLIIKVAVYVMATVYKVGYFVGALNSFFIKKINKRK